MKSAIAVSARATEPAGVGAICRACGVDCATVAVGRAPRYPSDAAGAVGVDRAAVAEAGG
jgi:hypothetical protein